MRSLGRTTTTTLPSTTSAAVSVRVEGLSSRGLSNSTAAPDNDRGGLSGWFGGLFGFGGDPDDNKDKPVTQKASDSGLIKPTTQFPFWKFINMTSPHDLKFPTTLVQSKLTTSPAPLTTSPQQSNTPTLNAASTTESITTECKIHY